ncbi:hypothetical protein [Dactylosporangium salmoneum]|uniref:Sigma-70 family RNA polymerase sigma factor n=1 Tax=Dactylosporangium salmoneum TaxID=53361 RepID=A0ABN3G9N8_9ACTN
MRDQDRPTGGPPQEADDLGDLVRAYNTAGSHADGAADMQRRFELWNALTEKLSELHDLAMSARDRVVTEIWQSESLSLAKLADRVGLSKARADQIIREQTGRPASKRTPRRKDTSHE